MPIGCVFLIWLICVGGVCYGMLRYLRYDFGKEIVQDFVVCAVVLMVSMLATILIR